MKNEIRYADLFGGVGGFRLGIERASNNRELLQRERSENKKDFPKSEVRSQGFNDNESRATNLSERERSQQRGNEIDLPNNKQKLFPTKQFTCVWYNDNDKYAVQTYNKNFNENYEATDIRTIKTDSIPEIDMLCGGFPCQAFSIAGKRRGFQDTRGTLFFEIARIIKAKRPKIIFLENVKGLLNHNKGETFSIIIQTLSELGYDVQWMVLNSKFFGVPQNRERVFIIGSSRGTSRPEILPFRYNDKEIIGKTDSERMEQTAQTLKARDYENWNGNFTEDGNIRALSGGGHSGGLHSQMTFIHNVYGGFKEGIRESTISPTIRTPKGGGHLPMVCKTIRKGGRGSLTKKHAWDIVEDGISIRRLTPIECELLQSFPKNWTKYGINKKGEEVLISDSQRFKMMGNAVTVKVVQAIAQKLLSRK